MFLHFLRQNQNDAFAQFSVQTHYRQIVASKAFLEGCSHGCPTGKEFEYSCESDRWNRLVNPTHPTSFFFDPPDAADPIDPRLIQLIPLILPVLLIKTDLTYPMHLTGPTDPIDSTDPTGPTDPTATLILLVLLIVLIWP